MNTTDLVQVHLYAAARAAVGVPSLTESAGSLADILSRIAASHPAFQQVWPRCSFLIDEVAVHGDLHQVVVAGGSRIDVLPPFAGG